MSLETFVAEIRADRERAAGAYELRPVNGTLRLELQYLLQHEADVGRALQQQRFNDLVTLLAGEPVLSVLDREAGEWRRFGDRATGKRSLRLGALLVYLRERLCELRDQAVDPWAPDRWRVARLPLAGDYLHDRRRR